MLSTARVCKAAHVWKQRDYRTSRGGITKAITLARFHEIIFYFSHILFIGGSACSPPFPTAKQYRGVIDALLGAYVITPRYHNCRASLLRHASNNKTITCPGNYRRARTARARTITEEKIVRVASARYYVLKRALYKGRLKEREKYTRVT